MRARSALAVVRAGWGCFLVVVTPGMLRALGLPWDGRAIVVMRVLGVRQLAQAVICRRGRFLRVGALVDSLHAMSMLLLASTDVQRRRAALLDATVASGFAVAGLTTAGSIQAKGSPEAC